MAKLKMLKMPKAPKLPKKPSASASLRSKQAYIAKVKELQAKHRAKVAAIIHENKKRENANKESAKLSQVISGISGVELFATGYKAVNRRLPRPGAKINGVGKKRKSPKKTAKRKATKTAKRKTTKRR